ncbi:PREDICTED: probable inactive tRNA-specific adenosine deaminase-like protein 3 [Rhagoletis zephyria]|uniref:probable inactive tRNA-specific adenosine deaminase-like protein 3 n=1 Tax=Rhagoletis zephyria TaxID=28612 RepID=UPI0008116C4B|nr:PREDICTED: probable inactive tRNA-specific adenosine deaminase-like protein 3 [Rhagoletis zephyria]
MAEGNVHPTKRLRLTGNSDWHACAILTDEYSKESPLVRVYLSQLESKSQISSVMQELSKLLPMEHMGLQHLKRVRQQEIILYKVKDINNQTSRKYLNSLGFSKETVEILCRDVREYDVPAFPPRLRWQYELAQQRWPSKFHANKYMELLYDGSMFSEGQRIFHSKVWLLLNSISSELEHNKPCSICIDPRNDTVVALAASRTTLNPVMHCPMVLVDFVARTQSGGAWLKEFSNEFQSIYKDSDSSNDFYSVTNGIPEKYLEFIQSDARFKDLKIGAEPLRTKTTVQSAEQTTQVEDNLVKYGPYLCTGYDVYLSQEPCLMCAMALVHSRVRRIYFDKRSTNGALVTRLKLHSVKELNHHYEVFECKRKSNNECCR